MRRWLSILTLVLLFSCAGEYRNEMPNKSADMVSEDLSVSEDDQYALLLKNKLQENHELTQLKLAHPEFEVSLKDSLFFAEKRKGYATIEAVEILETSTKDTIDLFKIVVLFKTGNTDQRDTIVAKITSKELKLAGEKVTSRTIEFID